MFTLYVYIITPNFPSVNTFSRKKCKTFLIAPGRGTGHARDR